MMPTAQGRKPLNVPLTCKKTDLQIKVLRIPGAKDPDEFIKAKGADAYRRLIEHSDSDNAYRLDTIAAQYDLDEDEERVRFLHEAAASLAKIDNVIVRFTPDAPQKWHV